MTARGPTICPLTRIPKSRVQIGPERQPPIERAHPPWRACTTNLIAAAMMIAPALEIDPT
jgi:hypothetical protein